MYRQLAGKPEAMVVSVTMAPSASMIFDPEDAGLVDLPWMPNLLEAILEECDWIKVQAVRCAQPANAVPAEAVDNSSEDVEIVDIDEI